MSGNKCFHLLNGVNNGTSKYSIDASNNVELSTTGGVFDSTKPCYHSLSSYAGTVLSFKTDTTDESLKTSTYTIELRVNPIEWHQTEWNTLLGFPTSAYCATEGMGPEFYYNDLSAGTIHMHLDSDVPTIGKWFHFAICQENGEYWIWYNEKLLTHFSISKPYVADFNRVNLFKYNDLNPVCHGYLDDLKITVGQALYKTNPITKNLKQY